MKINLSAFSQPQKDSRDVVLMPSECDIALNSDKGSHNIKHCSISKQKEWTNY